MLHHYVHPLIITNYSKQAVEPDPHNPCVKASLDGGYENVMIIDPRSPTDICLYFKDQGNEFNLVGAPPSFVEACEKAFLIYDAWTHAVKNKMAGATTKSDHPDYEKDMFKWMQHNYPGSFETYKEWDNAKSLYKKLTSVPCNADAPDGETLWDVFKAAGKL